MQTLAAALTRLKNGGMIVLLLFILAIAIALGVVKIIELVYLNRSAKLYE